MCLPLGAHSGVPLHAKGGKVKKELMEILACPGCKGELELKVETEEDDEVIKGSLLCSRCHESYPIDDAIPNLLPPQMRS
jgi:uncharacterized protein YbaR (Trm112 family)